MTAICQDLTKLRHAKMIAKEGGCFIVENGEWFCDVHNGVIPRDFVPQGCPSYVPITAITQNV